MAAMLVIVNGIPVMAQENIDDQVYAEYNEKKEAGLEVYDLRDDDGNFMGYYEPYSEANPNPNDGIMPHVVRSVDWTINAGRSGYSDEQFILVKGMTLGVNIRQSRTGRSYLLLYGVGTDIRITTTETTNGWDGTITFSYELVPGGYNFGIENASSNQIRYYGIYAIPA